MQAAVGGEREDAVLADGDTARAAAAAGRRAAAGAAKKHEAGADCNGRERRGEVHGKSCS